MPFLSDAFKVLAAFSRALARYVLKLGFETLEFVVMRNEERRLVTIAGGTEPPYEGPRYRRVKLTVPGWSELTRMPHRFERGVRFLWV